MRKKAYARLWAQERARKPLVADADETDLPQPQASSLVSWHRCCRVMPQLPDTHKPQCSSSRHSATQMNHDQQPQMTLDQQPQMTLDQQPQMNLDHQPQMTLDQQPQMNLDQQPQMTLDQQPQMNCDQQPQMNLDQHMPQMTLHQQPCTCLPSPVSSLCNCADGKIHGDVYSKKQVHFNTSQRVLPFLNWTAMLNAPPCTAVRPHWLLVTRRVTPQWSWRFAVVRSVTVVSPTPPAAHRQTQMHTALQPLKNCRHSGCGESPTPPAAHRQIQMYNAL